MDRRKVDCVIASLLIVVAIVILTNNNWVEGGVESALGSMTLPRIVAVFILMFATVIGIQSLYALTQSKVSEDELIDTRGFFNVAIYIGVFFAYWWLMPILGFLISTPLMMLAISALLGCSNYPAMVAVSAVVTPLLFYGCQHFLYVFLPTMSFI